MTSGNKTSKTLRNSDIVIATKWSTLAELISKLFLPVSSLVLAHILSPTEFGIVATITMVLSFSDIISDAGFQKFIIQHKFANDDSLYSSANVAFWTNQLLSFIIWIFIAVFRTQIASVVGSPGHGNAFVLACVNIPLVGFSSIQSGLLKRALNFKPLFYIRVFSSIVPFAVTIPLAIIFKNYWALIIGTTAKNILTSVLLIIFTHWKPNFTYSFNRLKEMLSFSFWSMVETLSIWLNQYIDIFLVGTLLSQHYLGLYKTSITLVGQCVGIITSIFTPIIFSSLSKLQDNDYEFKRLFFRFQKLIAILIMPIGVILFTEREFLTQFFLGGQWLEASAFIGIWGLTSALSVASVRYCSELYRAKGRPLLCFIVQIAVLIFLIPSIYYSAKIGFDELCLARSGVEVVYFAINIIICYFCFNISLRNIVTNLRLPAIASCGLYLVLYLSLRCIDIVWIRILIIIISTLLYFGVVSYTDREIKDSLSNYLISKFKFK